MVIEKNTGSYYNKCVLDGRLYKTCRSFWQTMLTRWPIRLLSHTFRQLSCDVPLMRWITHPCHMRRSRNHIKHDNKVMQVDRVVNCYATTIEIAMHRIYRPVNCLAIYQLRCKITIICFIFIEKCQWLKTCYLTIFILYSGLGSILMVQYRRQRETHDSGFCLNGLPSTQQFLLIYEQWLSIDLIQSLLFMWYLWVRTCPFMKGFDVSTS